jgi:hypothetical protein
VLQRLHIVWEQSSREVYITGHSDGVDKTKVG